MGFCIRKSRPFPQVTLCLRRGVLATVVLGYATSGYATIAAHLFEDKEIPYARDVNVFRGNLDLEVTATKTAVPLKEKHIKTRVQKSKTSPIIEPMQLTIENKPQKILETVTNLAKKEEVGHFYQYLMNQLPKAQPVRPGSETKLVDLTEEVINMLSPEKFAEQFTKWHHQVVVATSRLRQDTRLRGEFMRQLSAFFTPQAMQDVQRKLALQDLLTVDQDLLPPFPHRMIRKHTVYRGPNCFHAALAFQSQNLTRSIFVNVREEPGYHRSMINYDELWRVVQRHFYEIDPQATSLNYGDLLLFFDTPATAGTVDFHAIRHAATYLFNGFVFSKGSKSANTPYIVRTLGEEWDTWKEYTQNIGVKVFRRNLKNVRKVPPEELADWIY